MAEPPNETQGNFPVTQANYDISLSWLQNGCSAQAKFIIYDGVTALIGPSGAGKTTLARMLAGLSQPDGGYIVSPNGALFNSQKNINLPPSKRGIGYVSQEPALFPTMSVRKNMELASKLNENELRDLCAVSGVEDLLERGANKLSGGEARRVAIVRALAAKPKLLILDEPMNGLDPKRRKGLLGLIRKLSTQTNTPTLLITHQIEEMLLAADHGVLIADNRTSVAGTIEHVLAAKQTSELLGIDDAGSILETVVSKRTEGLLQTDIGSQNIWLSDDGENVGSTLRLRILSRDISISLKHLDGVSVLNQLEGIITNIVTKNHDQLLELSLTGTKQYLWARITNKSMSALQLSKGDKIYALVKAVAVKEMMVEKP